MFNSALPIEGPQFVLQNYRLTPVAPTFSVTFQKISRTIFMYPIVTLMQGAWKRMIRHA
jgi:hypothetical protein